MRTDIDLEIGVAAFHSVGSGDKRDVSDNRSRVVVPAARNIGDARGPAQAATLVYPSNSGAIRRVFPRV